jgi:hypothetical protein
MSTTYDHWEVEYSARYDSISVAGSVGRSSRAQDGNDCGDNIAEALIFESADFCQNEARISSEDLPGSKVTRGSK